MQPTADPGVTHPDPPLVSPAPKRRITVERLVTGVFVAGLVAVVVVSVWLRDLPAPASSIPANLAVALGYATLAMLAELIYYPVRRGDSREELTFFEVTLLGGVLVLPPTTALLGAVLGTVLAEVILTRAVIKAAFNIGSISLSSAVIVLMYQFLGAGHPPFSIVSVVALLTATLVFVFVNLALLAWIMSIADGVPALPMMREQAGLTVAVAVGGVGVASTGVALWGAAPALVPFALLPAAALWLAYGASAAHSEAVERNRWMLEIASTLVSSAPTPQILPPAADAIRRFFGADEITVVLGDATFITDKATDLPTPRLSTPADRELAAAGTAAVVPMTEGVLPAGWLEGSFTTLEIDRPGTAVIALGASHSPPGLTAWIPWATKAWRLPEVDRPVFATLAASLANAIRANERLEALREETAKLGAVVDHATDGIAVFAADTSVVLWSPALAAITGIGEQQARGHGGGDNAEVERVLRPLRGAAAKPGAESQTVTITRTDGETRELDIAVVAIDDTDAAMRVATIRDVTQQRRVDRMKSDFIATVSHELRTPITPIKGYAQLLSSRWDRMTPEKRTEVLHTIQSRADHLSRLVDDLLLASRVSQNQRARLDVHVSEADLAELVHETAAAFPALAERISISGITTTVAVDRVRAIQCLSNLIGNAGKYSPPDTPISVEFHPLAEQPWAIIDVKDHGRGIPTAELDKVFDRFYRVEDPMTMTTGGSGLGLFIARELARAMGGDITAESTLGHGSTFRLLLPVVATGARP